MGEKPELHLKKDRDKERTHTHTRGKKGQPPYTLRMNKRTQLFFFFFLASSSLRLLISVLLELAVRHGMLSVEFWRFIGISVDQEKRKLSQYRVFFPPSCDKHIQSQRTFSCDVLITEGLLNNFLCLCIFDL